LRIAERNLVLLETGLKQPESREPLGFKEHFGATVDKVQNHVAAKASRVWPSRREGALRRKTREATDRMMRGMVALEASLCFQAALERAVTSPKAAQMLSMKRRLGVVRRKFHTQFETKKRASLRDYRYFDSDKKRDRLEQDLKSLLGAMDAGWETLEELERQWQNRSKGLPESCTSRWTGRDVPWNSFFPRDDTAIVDPGVVGQAPPSRRSTTSSASTPKMAKLLIPCRT
jgi:hypothetical protein